LEKQPVAPRFPFSVLFSPRSERGGASGPRFGGCGRGHLAGTDIAAGAVIRMDANMAAGAPPALPSRRWAWEAWAFLRPSGGDDGGRRDHGRPPPQRPPPSHPPEGNPKPSRPRAEPVGAAPVRLPPKAQSNPGALYRSPGAFLGIEREILGNSCRSRPTAPLPINGGRVRSLEWRYAHPEPGCTFRADSKIVRM
jgi:hypothetical protein